MGIRVVFTLFSVAALMVIFGANQDAYAMSVFYNDGPPSGNTFFNQIPTRIVADDFVPDHDADFEDVHFWITQEIVNFDNQVEYFVYDDNGGVPGTQLDTGFGQSVTVTPDAVCFRCYKVWMDLENPVSVNQGQTYWLALRLPFATLIPNNGLIVDDTVVGNNAQVSIDGGTNWNDLVASLGGQLVELDIPFELTQKLAVGGEFIRIETATLLLAGSQNTAAWMIPVIVSGIGIAIVIARKF